MIGRALHLFRDTRAVVWRDWREHVLRGRGVATTVTMVMFVLLLGVVLPWRVGAAWLSAPWVAVVWAWLPVFLVTSVTADTFAGERERGTLEPLLATRLPDGPILYGKVLATVAYVGTATVVALPLGVLTVNLTGSYPDPVLLGATEALGLALLSLVAALFGAAAGVLLSLRASSVREAQQSLSVVILLLSLAPLLGLPALPESWRGWLVGVLMQGGVTSLVPPLAGGLVAMAVVLLLLARLRFTRERLVTT